MDFFVIGDDEVVIGFGFVGVEGTVARTREEALAAFRKATSGEAGGPAGSGGSGGPAGNVKILILTEQVADLIPDEVMDWQMNGSYPLIVDVPGIGGRNPDRQSLMDSIREAVGLHV